MKDILNTHFGYENLTNVSVIDHTDFNYLTAKRDLLNDINDQIESGKATTITHELRIKITNDILIEEHNLSARKEERWFSSLFMPPIK